MTQSDTDSDLRDYCRKTGQDFDAIVEAASKHFMGPLPTKVVDVTSLPWTEDDEAWAQAVDKAIADNS